jgi:CBS domain-containing protein
MLVRDFMNYQVYTATPNTTVQEVLAMFEKNCIGGVPVVDKQGILLGIVTDGDILRFLSPKNELLFLPYYMNYNAEVETVEDRLKEGIRTAIGEIMVKKNIKTLSPEDNLESAIRLISKHHFKKIPVVNGAGRVVGIISRGDMIKYLSKKTADQNFVTI